MIVSVVMESYSKGQDRKSRADLTPSDPFNMFGMDGVILDSMPYHRMRAWQEALSEQGFSVSAELHAN